MQTYYNRKIDNGKHQFCIQIKILWHKTCEVTIKEVVYGKYLDKFTTGYEDIFKRIDTHLNIAISETNKIDHEERKTFEETLLTNNFKPKKWDQKPI